MVAGKHIVQGRRRFLHPVDDMVVHFEASGAQERTEALDDLRIQLLVGERLNEWIVASWDQTWRTFAMSCSGAALLFAATRPISRISALLASRSDTASAIEPPTVSKYRFTPSGQAAARSSANLSER